MRTLLNIIWFVFSGFWLWVAYMLAGIICCLLIVTIPWGIASFRMANYAAWPFGREVIDKPTAGIGALLGNIVWVVLAGWWLALTHIVTGILLLVTIIGIPLAIANFKLIPISLLPLGKQIVSRPYYAGPIGPSTGSATTPTTSHSASPTSSDPNIR